MSPLSEVIQREERRAPRISPPRGKLDWAGYLRFCWSARRCFICQKRGECRHRERKAESVRAWVAAR